NAILLGRIIEKTVDPSGQTSYATILQRKILDPLRMTHTTYPTGLGLPKPHLYGRSVMPFKDGHAGDVTYWNPSFAQMAGQLISNMDDMKIWARTLGTGALLKPETRNQRLEPNPSIPAGARRTYAVGVGLDHGWIGHAG